MNEGHRRRILATYRHADSLLREAVQALSCEGGDSPFDELVRDGTPLQHRVALDLASQARQRMREALERLGIPVPAPTIPATRSARTQVLFAEVDLEDLDPGRLRGYGILDATAARTLEESNAEILALLGQLRTFLEAGDAADLESRAGRLPPGTLPGMIHALARIVQSRNLVALRPALTRLVEALEQEALEVAVFGRVSAGKSSLLNHLLGQPVLPVGATPVTALVLRLGYGPEARVHLRFATSPPRTVPVEALPAYATEQENPGNRKQVAEIRVDVPSPLLQPGVVFVDTPGLGSLARAGADETLAYLPRADVGVLLMDATAALAPGDLTLLEALLRAGVQPMVLLSKADLLAPADRNRVLAYAKESLADQLGRTLPIHLVSVTGPESALTDRWFDAEIRPLLVDHQARRQRSLKGKALLLRDQVLSLLQRSGAASDRLERATAEQRLREGEHRLAQARSSCLQQIRDLASDIPGQLEAAPADPDAFEALLARALQHRHGALLGELTQLQADLAEALEAAAKGLGLPASDPLAAPDWNGLPPFDGTTVMAAWPRNGASSWLPGALAQPLWHRALRNRLEKPLAQAFQVHRRALEAWCQSRMDNLEQAFQANAGFLRAQVAPSSGTGGDAELAADLQILEHLGSPP